MGGRGGNRGKPGGHAAKGSDIGKGRDEPPVRSANDRGWIAPEKRGGRTPAADENGYNDENYDRTNWNEGWDDADEGVKGDWGTWNQAEGHAEQAFAVPHRRIASSWRWFDRVLRRVVPEERIYDAAQQLLPGDHIVVHHAWRCSEQHGILCSTSFYGDSSRRGAESQCVIHWDGNQIVQTALSKFVDGGELSRVIYPLWACQCLQPTSSTVKPQLLAEQRVEATSDDLVVRCANSVLQRGWAPRISEQAGDLEFCLFAKTGGGHNMPAWEIHGRKVLEARGGQSSCLDRPVGCLLSGSLRPSQILVGASVPVQQSLYPPVARQQVSILQQQRGQLGRPAQEQNLLDHHEHWQPAQQPQVTRHQQAYYGASTGGPADFSTQEPHGKALSLSAKAKAFIPTNPSMPWDSQRTGQSAYQQSESYSGTVYQ